MGLFTFYNQIDQPKKKLFLIHIPYFDSNNILSQIL